MELSIIQHAKDTKPRTVSVGEVAEMIRNEAWPRDYPPTILVQGVFEGGVRQQDITRMSGLAVTEFKMTGSSPAGVGDFRQTARDDPHTLLMFTSDDRLTVIYAYEVDKSYDLESQRKFYQRVLLYGNDYYESLLGMSPVRKGHKVGKLCTLCHDPDVYYNLEAEWFLAMTILGATRPGSGKLRSTEGLRERKPNYKELLMTVDEIDDWLDRHIELHRNLVSGQKEFRWKEEDAAEGTGPWENYDDHTLNSIYRRMKKVKDVRRDEIDWEICSDYVKDFHPFIDYLEHLPPWDGDDYIRELAMGVTVDGNTDDWIVFSECLRKWLVAMVAGWLNPHVVNQTVLVFIGHQGIKKTTWMKLLLPPQLQKYYCTQVGVGRNDKDRELAMSQNGLICCEELDTMTASEMNAMKRDITMLDIKVRPAYHRHTEHHTHIASFCGTGNNEKFLNDPTGTRRWLAFKVVRIDSPTENPFNYTGIYTQAYYLYRNGFKYWDDDTKAIEARNERFKVANLEKQLVNRYFRLPAAKDGGEFFDVATVMQQFPGNLTSKLRKEAVDQAFIDLGFQPVTVDGIPGYYAIKRMPEELQTLGTQMALKARGDTF
jgi:hypothetical protein